MNNDVRQIPKFIFENKMILFSYKNDIHQIEIYSAFLSTTENRTETISEIFIHEIRNFFLQNHSTDIRYLFENNSSHISLNLSIKYIFEKKNKSIVRPGSCERVITKAWTKNMQKQWK